jgi:hypothetical protein
VLVPPISEETPIETSGEEVSREVMDSSEVVAGSEVTPGTTSLHEVKTSNALAEMRNLNEIPFFITGPPFLIL